jgi:hypothetical protein
MRNEKYFLKNAYLSSILLISISNQNLNKVKLDNQKY